MFLIYKTSFDSAHKIEDSALLLTKKCANKHGHTYNLTLYLDLDDMISFYQRDFIDFELIKTDVNKLLEKYDHQDVTELHGLHTVEDIASDLKCQLLKFYNPNNEYGIHFELFETAKFGVKC